MQFSLYLHYCQYRLLLQGRQLCQKSLFLPECSMNYSITRLFLDVQDVRDCMRRETCMRMKDPEIWQHLNEILLAPYKHFSSLHIPIWTDLSPNKYVDLPIWTDMRNPSTDFHIRSTPPFPNHILVT